MEEYTTLYFCKNVDLDPNNEYTIDFDNIETQRTYFQSKVVEFINVNEFSHVRKDESIKVGVNIDDLFGVNYLFFTNKDKTYYAYITDKKYISKSCTAITFKIDVLQSFMFDYTIEESFVEREHQDRWNKDNTPIFNVIEENISYGNNYENKVEEISIKNVTTRGTKKDLLFIYIFANKPLVSTTANERFTDCYIKTGHYLYFAICQDIQAEESDELVSWANTRDSSTIIEFASIQSILDDAILENEYINQIIISKIPLVDVDIYEDDNGNIVVYPLSNFEAFKVTISGHDFAQVYGRNKEESFLKIKDFEQLIEPISLDIDTIKNIKNEPKLYVYPYNFKKLYFGGNELEIKNEYLKNTKLYVYQSLSNEGTSLVFLKNYLTQGDLSINNMFSISNQVAPTVDLATNAWKNYMLTNKSQRTAGFVNQGASLLSGIVTGIVTGGLGLFGGINMAVQSGTQINSQLAKEKDIRNQPNDIKQFNGDLSLSIFTTNLLPKEIEYTITNEQKNIIFNYFFHYGYKCNDFKKPNVRSRYYFNYIKTIGVNLKTNIDGDFRRELEDIYNNGITIWHFRNANKFKGVNNFDYENVEMNLLEVNNG